MHTYPLHNINHSFEDMVVSFDRSLRELIKPEISSVFLDLYSACVQAGFPSPADDYVEKSLDLNEYLISHPAATYFFRVSGDTMRGAGIYNDDILVVDRSLKAKNNSIIIAVINGELMVKRLKIEEGIYRLVSENPTCSEIVITEEMGLTVWGVATSVIHKL